MPRCKSCVLKSIRRKGEEGSGRGKQGGAEEKRDKGEGGEGKKKKQDMDRGKGEGKGGARKGWHPLQSESVAQILLPRKA